MPTPGQDQFPKAAAGAPSDDAFGAAIVRNAVAPIIGLDLRGAVVSWNDAAARFFGYAPADIAGRPVNRIIAHSHRPQLTRICAALRDGQRPGPFNTRVVTATGAATIAAVTASPVRDKTGAIMAISLIVQTPDMPASTRQPLASKAPPRPILVVEHEALIGLGLVAMLENAGFAVIGPASDVQAATDLLDRHDCALAILDIHLWGETSAPIARRLKAEGIPFLVTSAHPASSQAAAYGETPNIPKPWRASSLVAAVHDVLG